MAVSSENAKLDPHPRDAGVEARRSESFLFFGGRTPRRKWGKAGRPFRPFRASGIAPSVGGAAAVFFSLVVRRTKSKAKNRVGKPSDFPRVCWDCPSSNAENPRALARPGLTLC